MDAVEHVNGVTRRGLILLEDGATRASVAAECRAAWQELMDGIAEGWDKTDLALWLTGPYARATRHRERGERHFDVDRSALIPDDTIESLLTRVRGQTLAELETIVLDKGAFARAQAVADHGLVRRALDKTGTWTWIPIDGSRMRLRERVLSLLVADWLDDPLAWRALYVCHRCESVTFDEGARKIGHCARHRRLSGFVVKEEDAPDTLRGGAVRSGGR
jgi:hypothetical protein